MSKNLNPKEDFCKIVKKEKKDKKIKPKRKYRKVKNNINIPKVISRYKNPRSEMVSLEERRPVEEKQVINYKKFIDFNKCLDKIEEICKKEHKSLQ